MITYNYEFKILFIDEYIAGKLPRQIFAENGFDINVIGLSRIEQSACRWNTAYKKDGIIGLEDTWKTASGRPRSTELTKEEIIERQDAKIKLLEVQVELLKKLDAKERQVIQKNNKLSQSMSRKGNCWDNAPQESFFGHMKDEIDLKSCATLEDVKKMIDRYITYYNNYRYQWNLKKMARLQYRNHLLA